MDGWSDCHRWRLWNAISLGMGVNCVHVRKIEFSTDECDTELLNWRILRFIPKRPFWNE